MWIWDFLSFFFFFNTWINHFKAQEWRTRWNWKHRTIFHSFLQLSPLFFASFKFHSLCEEIQSIEFCGVVSLKSFIPLYLGDSPCYRYSVLGSYIQNSSGDVWGTYIPRRVIFKFKPVVQTGDQKFPNWKTGTAPFYVTVLITDLLPHRFFFFFSDLLKSFQYDCEPTISFIYEIMNLVITSSLNLMRAWY